MTDQPSLFDAPQPPPREHIALVEGQTRLIHKTMRMAGVFVASNRIGDRYWWTILVDDAGDTCHTVGTQHGDWYKNWETE